MSTLAPAVISTKEAHHYVGGIKIWWELLALYHKTHLKPLRTLPRGDQYWLVAKLDAVLRMAEMEGSLNDRRKVDAALADAIAAGVVPKTAKVKASEESPPN